MISNPIVLWPSILNCQHSDGIFEHDDRVPEMSLDMERAIPQIWPKFQVKAGICITVPCNRQVLNSHLEFPTPYEPTH